MQLHELQPSKPRKTAKRVGRGGKRGKTSGKGMKGQKARAGNSTRPEMREIIKKLPKLRGHGKNRARTVNAERELSVVINVATLDKHFENGDTVSPKTLLAKGLLRETAKKVPTVKLLGTGELTKKLSVQHCVLSASAREKIEKAGGSIA